VKYQWRRSRETVWGFKKGSKSREKKRDRGNGKGRNASWGQRPEGKALPQNSPRMENFKNHVGVESRKTPGHGAPEHGGPDEEVALGAGGENEPIFRFSPRRKYRIDRTKKGTTEAPRTFTIIILRHKRCEHSFRAVSYEGPFGKSGRSGKDIE